ncbi:ribosomal RNA-processing protein 7 isoform X5 [Magnolia sinica]|uniref:ribosomal RNA-processing protein 7 isoform X5 n=1 Tax=Magnolia sinica TaxID=86752 RepID=UPI002657B2E7|nr:ribosomal RNA-processing protein 7 isoform X5 [Magnolia sinica]
MDGKSRKEGRSSKKGRHKLKKKKLLEKEGFVEPHEVNHICFEKEDGPEFMKEDEPSTADREKKRDKSMTRKKRKKEKGTEVADGEVNQLGYEDEDGSNEVKSGGITGNGKAKKLSQSKKQIKVNGKAKKSSQSKKQIKVDSVESNEAHAGTDVAIKWITEYHTNRPGLKILQQRIDAFTTAHEAQEEQAKKERESRVAEGGWTVVKHHKGRKKTTDSESGVAVGAVAEAAVLDKMAQKKKKGVALNFYNFQRREAQRNEVMMLQSKFEQDKKRIQQMRAARKFRPY